jgi:hypothetical protein
MAVDADDVRAVALSLPRATEGIVRDSVRWRVGRIVFAAMSPDETYLGFAYPKEERDALVASDPDKFVMPRPSELRWNWVGSRTAALDVAEMRELVIDAWRMCVPKKLREQV